MRPIEETRRARTTEEVLALLIVLLLGAVLVLGIVLPRLGATVTSSGAATCRHNLHQLAQSLAIYLDGLGDGRWYPFPLGRGLAPDDYTGAEWLASLYWTRVLPDPTMLLCPSSGDANREGAHVGTVRAIAGRFGSQTVSYAALHYRSLTDTQGRSTPGAIPAGYPHRPVDQPAASDDTEGTLNHGTAGSRGTSILFFDGHVEFWPPSRIDIRRAVGSRPGPLAALRN